MVISGYSSKCEGTSERHLSGSVLSSVLFSMFIDNFDDAIFMLVKSVLKNPITSKQ